MNELVQRFHIARGKAIDYYAQYEVSLGLVFSKLMDVPPDFAGVPFFKINNAPARIQIVDRLLHKRHGSKYNAFWNSLSGPLRDLDTYRNQVVHWLMLTHLDTAKRPQMTHITLTPPNIYDRRDGVTDLTIDDINQFAAKAKFYGQVLGMFHVFLLNPENVKPAWRDIFHQPVVYPPPDTHPLVQIAKEQKSQLPTSLE
jgi:hypothetical protein